MPAYWIVNLVDRRLEIYTSPAPTGYREKCLLGPDDQVAVMIGGEEVGRFAVAAILPRGGAAGGTDAAKNP